jgi:DNA repair exonuclease SbcCD nuclease subunit
MRLVHLSDLHLGFRQYQRLTPNGINQREADVATAFRRAIDKTIELKPDLILVAGDVFHTVRPSNPAIVLAFTQFARLTQAVPEARIIMVGGNHDQPRSSETGCILRLFRELNIEVVETAPKRVDYPELDLSVLAVPFTTEWPRLDPDPASRFNILLLHGPYEGLYSQRMVEERGLVEITRKQIAPERWSYVALGHYHVHREIEPNMFYSGSLEYTSANIWGDRSEEQLTGFKKGIIEYDLSTGTHRRHALQLERQVIDLPEQSAAGMTAAELDAAIREAVEGAADGPIDDHIVRLLVHDVQRHVARELNHAALRDYKRRALHFHLDTRRPEIIRMHGGAGPGRRPSLAEVVREKLASRVITSDIDRAALVDLGLEYLREAEALDTASLIEGHPA